MRIKWCDDCYGNPGQSRTRDFVVMALNCRAPCGVFAMAGIAFPLFRSVLTRDIAGQ